MSDHVMSDLEPRAIFDHFYQITQIPRSSKNEKKIREYVIKVAKRNNLEYREDATGNVVVVKPASPGFEKVPIVILQGHLDMVCEKNKSTVHDFMKDPIKLIRESGYVKADGTTLGADNGIGVSTALTILEDKTLQHGPLELLFTIDEETGLTGATNIDSKILKGRYLLNLDSEEDGVLYVGCAGGKDSLLTLPVQWEPAPAKHIRAELKITGCRGGHSGVDIHEGRANAIKLLVRVLWNLSKKFKIRIGSIEAGSKRNAIPREGEAILFIPKGQMDAATIHAAELEGMIQKEFESIEKNIKITLTVGKGKGKVIKKGPVDKLLQLLYAIPHGVIKMSPDIPGLVETSTNLATITVNQKNAVIGTSQRSSVETEKQDIVDRMAAIAKLAGAQLETTDGYPGWKPNLNSKTLKVAKETFRDMFHKDPEIKAIHAGLECGIIGEKLGEMDMVSFGPTIQNAHSPDERLVVASVKPFYEFLTAVLKRVAKN